VYSLRLKNRYGLKIARVPGMTGYHENQKNQLKFALNLNFTFKKLKIGKPVGMTSLPIGMTGTETGKSVGRQWLKSVEIGKSVGNTGLSVDITE
jgi:hypothetical protein